jgi:hypothetical protein
MEERKDPHDCTTVKVWSGSPPPVCSPSSTLHSKNVELPVDCSNLNVIKYRGSGQSEDDFLAGRDGSGTVCDGS